MIFKFFFLKRETFSKIFKFTTITTITTLLHLLLYYIYCPTTNETLILGHAFPPNGVKGGKMTQNIYYFQYTQNHVAELFARENCILLSPYKNIKSILTYKFNDSTYSVRFDNWLYLNSRPHKK